MNQKYKYFCRECKKPFSSKEHWTDHQRKHDRTFLRCQQCRKTFTSMRGLQVHMPLHTRKYPFHCNKCNAGFNRRSHLAAHEKKHEGIGYKCDICYKVCYSKPDLMDHQRKHEGTKLICPYCAKTFGTSKGLRYHTSKHTGKYQFPCNMCSAGFNMKSQLVAHESIHHGKDYKDLGSGYKCLKCPKVCYSKSDLEDHQRKHDGTKLICQYCAKPFGTSKGLEYHISVHTGKYQFYCSQCNAGFNMKSQLIAHEKNHHGK